MIFETAAAAKLRKGYLKIFGFVEADIFQVAFIDRIFEWQLAENEASTELKSSLHIGLF